MVKRKKFYYIDTRGTTTLDNGYIKIQRGVGQCGIGQVKLLLNFFSLLLMKEAKAFTSGKPSQPTQIFLGFDWGLSELHKGTTVGRAYS